MADRHNTQVTRILTQLCMADRHSSRVTSALTQLRMAQQVRPQLIQGFKPEQPQHKEASGIAHHLLDAPASQGLMGGPWGLCAPMSRQCGPRFLAHSCSRQCGPRFRQFATIFQVVQCALRFKQCAPNFQAAPTMLKAECTYLPCAPMFQAVCT
jgi:hypothetical protein